MNLQLAKEALKKFFGYDSFRPLQSDVIQGVYEGKDGLVLMPTGGGKSICYQIPAITLEGTCVVVSPLISLMKDQVEGLRSNGVRAAFLNSSLDLPEQRQIEDDLYNGLLDLLYVSPEKMTSQDFFPLLQRIQLNLFAIDEAHCISAWGHDFRPEYTRLQFLKRDFPNVPILALTATADKVTRQDIVQQLALPDPGQFIASFDRPNLSLEARPGQKRLEQILDFIRERPDQSGIIYCLSRKNTETLAEKLQANGIRAAYYHAGMPDMERSRVQDNFINDQTPVICATVAFGMGIDKSNVRWVIHYNLPQNIEGYYQEIGRAGRDGVKADTLLFYSFGDVQVFREILSQNEGDNRQIKLAKLERMYQYAIAQVCRRKILLSYFGENNTENCGNCDICKNPPTYFDATEIAQKALSAIARLKENVSLGMLIDVLRGSSRKEIFQNRFHEIKTYGAGKDLSFEDWRYYLEQLLNQGFIEVDHLDYNKLKLTDPSREVLFEGRKVEMVQADHFRKKQEEARERATRTKKQTLQEELFERLRQLRLQLARSKGIPPYLVFTDATLEAMASRRPFSDQEMLHIPGVGERKMQLYGDWFLKEVRDFIRTKTAEGARIPGVSHWLTYELFQQGLDIATIAARREVQEGTVYNHLAQVYELGEAVDLSRFIDAEECKRVEAVLDRLAPPFQLKPIYEALNEEVPYYKIRLAMALYFREKTLQDEGG